MSILDYFPAIHTDEPDDTESEDSEEDETGWKNAKRVLSKHESSLVHKQALLCWKDFATVRPVNFQLDQQAADQACVLKRRQERNCQVILCIIHIVVSFTRAS